MNILILGASGFLGGYIYEKVKSQLDFNVMGTCYRSNNCGDLIKLDVSNEEEVKDIIYKFKPDIILWSLISRESEKYLIEMGLNNILKYLSHKQKLIFMSTNAVFNGKGNYSEEDNPKYKNSNEPLALYSNAKIDGEKIVKEHDNHIIIRPGAIYGQDINGKWDKRISDLINKFEEKEEVVRTENLYNTFVKVDELAKAIIELIKCDYKGIIHLGPEKKESYYNYYRKMAIHLNLDTDLIKSNFIDEEYAAKNNRSLDLSINTSKCREVLGDIFSNV
ncbi:MAG: sugar nucleotide-binding protein [Clostridium argentinense]|nr:sugar nucleotide-binding protein [Clostridium argentinense]